MPPLLKTHFLRIAAIHRRRCQPEIAPLEFVDLGSSHGPFNDMIDSRTFQGAMLYKRSRAISSKAVICFRYRCTCAEGTCSQQMMSSRGSRSGGNPMLIVFRQRADPAEIPARLHPRDLRSWRRLRTFACSVSMTDTLKITGLDYAQQFCLWAIGMFGDLVHEKRAVIPSSNRPADRSSHR